ncbi:hypothetical protein SAMN05216559_0186 [Halomicrobium zhouii]|uniref:Uncharacterized protein n=1 Tax=Halomicrobium zhouii TaxID=767519 RepID=A0A1I6K4U3_9EURY|nr:hypothetical protein SAMN05216559_0186 [Halomicrobium zhouii]
MVTVSARAHLPTHVDGHGLGGTRWCQHSLLDCIRPLPPRCDFLRRIRSDAPSTSSDADETRTCGSQSCYCHPGLETSGTMVRCRRSEEYNHRCNHPVFDSVVCSDGVRLAGSLLATESGVIGEGEPRQPVENSGGISIWRALSRPPGRDEAVRGMSIAACEKRNRLGRRVAVRCAVLSWCPRERSERGRRRACSPGGMKGRGPVAEARRCKHRSRQARSAASRARRAGRGLSTSLSECR